MNNNKTQQENSGAYQCIAGEDYNELHVHFHYCPVCAEKNNLTIQHDERYLIEKSFKDRFGFSLNAELCILVIKLKEQVKLTDPEITLLKRCGALSVKNGKPVTLYSDRIGYIISLVLIAHCAFIVFIFSSVVFIRGNNIAIELLIVAVLSALFGFFCMLLHKLSIKPLKILRGIGINYGQKYTFPT